MKKTEAIDLFGSQSAIARALGVSRGYVSQWPAVLPDRLADRVTGAAVRLGLKPARRQPEGAKAA